MPDRVMIVTGETSGELYGSLLASALKREKPDILITGIGGERMRAAGVKILSGISGAFGIAEALTSLSAVRKSFTTALEALERERPAVLVLVDYPDFNLKLAAAAKKKGIRILYYVSPQVWAWRAKRVRKIANLVDRMAVILPFEENIYTRAGLECEFVGHPICDEIREMRLSKTEYRRELGLSLERPVISLLPGSRPNELKRLLPVIVDVVRDLRKKNDLYQFCVPFAPNTDLGEYGTAIDALTGSGAVITKGEALKALAVSDYGVIASGTASLQAVLLGLPIVVIYKLFPLTYLIGKAIVKVRHISLVNILCGRQVVRELLQSEANPANIIREIERIGGDRTYREAMLHDFRQVGDIFANKRASDRVAEIIFEMSGSLPPKQCS